MNNAFQLLLTITVFTMLAGCGGKGALQSVDQGAPSHPPPATEDAIGLMSPGDALANITDRDSSELLLDRNGSEYEAGLSQRVEVEDTSVRFTPLWSYSYPHFGKLAFAVYSFNVAGFSGVEEVQLDWGVEPIEYGNLWIGLSNWSSNSWTWFPGPTDGVLNFGDAGYVDYTQPDTGEMLVTVVMMGMDQARLDWLQIGQGAPEPVTITGVTPDPAEGYSRLNELFQVQFNGTLDETTTFHWDFGGGATPDNPTVQSPTVTLGNAGTYDCSVTVNNDYGDPDMFSFAMSVSENYQGAWPMFGHDAQLSRRSPYVGPQTDDVKWKFRTSGTGFGFNNAVLGPDGTIYVGSGPELHALNADGTLKWRSVNCNPSTRPALADDGTVYVGSAYPDSSLYALNSDGSLKWSFATDGPVYSAPIVNGDGTIYFGSNDSNVYALNPDGTLKWSFATGSDVRSSPVIGADGTVYVGSYDKSLYAINPDSSLKWSFPTGGPVTSSPSVGADGTVYVGSNDNKLYAINSDGTEKWSFTTGDEVGSSPTIGADGTVYVGSDDGNLFAVNADGTEQWSYPTGREIYSSPIIGADGTIYFGSYDSTNYALNPDGSLKWSFMAGWQIVFSPTVGADGTVYMGNDKLYAMNPDGSERWSYGSSGHRVDSSPAIASDGTVYVGSWDKHLYAINPDGTEKWAYLIGAPIFWSSPAVGLDGTIFVGSGYYGPARLSAINPDGSLRWEIPFEYGVESSPVIGSDGTVYVNADNLFAFAPDGTEKWTYPTGGGNFSPAIGTDGTVYVGTADHKLQAINPDGSLKWSKYWLAASHSAMAIGADGTLYVTDANTPGKLIALNPDSSQKWSFSPELAGYMESNPAIGSDGTIFVATGNNPSGPPGTLFAVNPDGTEKWSYTIGTRIYSSPAVDADGTVYVGCGDNQVYAFNPDGTILWSHVTGGEVSSSPAIGADGTVYVGSNDGKLYAFGT